MLIIDKTMQTNANEEEVQDELEVNEDDNDEGTTDSDAGQESEEHEDAEAVEETVSISKSELDKLRRESAAAKRLRERKEGAEKGSQESNQQYDPAFIEQVETLTLATAGISNPDIQDEARRLAKKTGLTLVEMLRDNDIKSILLTKQKSKNAQRAVAGTTGGASVTNKGLDYHIAQFKKTGTLPDDNKLVAQMLDALAKN